MHVTVYRCYDCKKIITDIDLKRNGKCPFCSGCRAEGANPSTFEIIKLYIRLLFMRKAD